MCLCSCWDVCVYVLGYMHVYICLDIYMVWDMYVLELFVNIILTGYLILLFLAEHYAVKTDIIIAYV